MAHSRRNLILFLLLLVTWLAAAGADSSERHEMCCMRKHTGAGDVGAMRRWRNRGAAAVVEYFRQVRAMESSHLSNDDFIGYFRARAPQAKVTTAIFFTHRT